MTYPSAQLPLMLVAAPHMTNMQFLLEISSCPHPLFLHASGKGFLPSLPHTNQKHKVSPFSLLWALVPRPGHCALIIDQQKIVAKQNPKTLFMHTN